MNKIDDNNNKIQINNFEEIKNEVKRKIGRPSFIRTDKKILKKKKNTIIYFD